MPYQITGGASEMNDPIGLGNYFKDGDWQDVLLSPGMNTGTIRLMTNKFNGHYLIHCHILEHEDNGMMAYLNVKGEENTTWSGASQLDPTCYRDDKPNPGYTLF